MAKEPMYETTMKVDLAAFNRAVALLNLPADALVSEDPGIRHKAELLGAKPDENTKLGCARFEDGTVANLWLRSDKRDYYVVWNLGRLSKKAQETEVLMLMTYETVIYDRWRYRIWLNPLPEEN